MKPARVLFRFEALITVVGGLIALAVPDHFVAQFHEASLSSAAYDFVRWLGVMYLVFGALWWRLLDEAGAAVLRVFLQVALVGDVLQLVFHGQVVAAGGRLGPEAIFALTFGAVLLIARIACLVRPGLVERARAPV